MAEGFGEREIDLILDDEMEYSPQRDGNSANLTPPPAPCCQDGGESGVRNDDQDNAYGGAVEPHQEPGRGRGVGQGRGDGRGENKGGGRFRGGSMGGGQCRGGGQGREGGRGRGGGRDRGGG
ncbi:PREDICTED: methyl-CpG-binding domain protein 2-like [Amphimedon queenslandica]|uniref:Uncharacterized protein n=1 Tax=Amphimedon queenslandica TaxID=400682 RepID=A0AAN0IKI1_AMPQE|nr:PREDICTED: methyl-CpG-binding domain protein 2-like [Amphimedon queenslandica]|eukprot:XP_011403095.1 PREDICTED: methyl-CpG-binding domain protein 2-like [Amphimedon queenslandica]